MSKEKFCINYAQYQNRWTIQLIIMYYEKRLIKQISIVVTLYVTSTTLAYSNQNELINLSVEDLLNIDVISVAKKAKSLNDSPAAIFVITQDDIKRIGATSIPEALRLAPGLDVARIDANKWAVTARGFNGRFANKLLVLIDGRNTYTRAFAGVYWENQDVMLEDIERIEIIRGPGAALWGANAVNGVINIISKHSADTQGGLLVAGGGTEKQGFGAFRYGGKLNTNTPARAYIKGFKRDENTHQSGREAGDDWNKVQGGFRLDSQFTARDNLTIQGDGYHSRINQNTTTPTLSAPYQNNFNETIDTFGGNLLIRQQHTFSSTSDYSLQFFYDFYQRDETFSKDSRHTVDIDFQHRFAFLNWNDVIWGAGYRYTHDDSMIKSAIAFNNINPNIRNDQLFSAFLQNEITLLDDSLWLTFGSKFEHNDYSGFEVQPTARIMWIPHHQHRLWGAVSRAVRTPSRLDHDISILGSVIPGNPPIAVTFNGNRQFDSEQVLSYELGYRTTIIDNVSIDFTAFYNNYKKLLLPLRKAPIPASGVIELPNTITNNAKTKTYGIEIATVWQMLDWWRWDANYSLLITDVDSQKETIDRSPQQRVSLRSALSPWHNFDIDILFRYVDRNTSNGISGNTIINDYVSMDIRLAWKPVNNIELSLVGQNLLAGHHLEYKQESFTSLTAIDRGIYGKLTWKF